MTKDEWLSLKPGDTVIEVASGTERKILSVSRHQRFNSRHIRTSITLSKIAKSGWTKRPTTTYNNHDDRGRWRLKKR
jgi:hypothetical protein